MAPFVFCGSCFNYLYCTLNMILKRTQLLKLIRLTPVLVHTQTKHTHARADSSSVVIYAQTKSKENQQLRKDTINICSKLLPRSEHHRKI